MTAPRSPRRTAAAAALALDAPPAACGGSGPPAASGRGGTVPVPAATRTPGTAA